MDKGLFVRSAQKSDREAIEDFLDRAIAIHRHLDWRTHLDWLGNKYFLLLEEQQKITALLICTAEPDEIFWIRVFGSLEFNFIYTNWQILLSSFLELVQSNESRLMIASIAYLDWMKNLLDESHWKVHQRVIQLRWNPDSLHKLEKKWSEELDIRPMKQSDLESIARIDNECFKFIWRQSQDVINRAYHQSSYSTVAIFENEIVGFQISTSHKSIAHLTRLAVSPKFQGQYIGQALTQNMLKHYHKPWIHEITVNTQNDNEVSLNLYRKMGFESTGEYFPVYLYEKG
jgi:ribosomal protein S18 acetylase RimI-like enzyme